MPLRPSVAARFGAFVLERYPFAAAAAAAALEVLADTCGDLSTADAVERTRSRLPEALRRALPSPPGNLPETTPAVAATARWTAAVGELVDACDGFLRRAAIETSLTNDERREVLRGMALTRATDNRLKAFFTGGEVRYGDATFQGKGFRSLGQEAIYAAGIRLRRGDAYRVDGEWRGDVVAPLIRDLGVTLAMKQDAEGEAVRMVLSSQMAKSGPPMHGKDLHFGDFASGILPAAAPLTIGTMTIAGMALAFARAGDGRVALSFIGEGGSSLGEWHEAINLCAARRLPAIFCVQNNQTALSTPVTDQSAVRVFADKAAGYGIPGITIDGTDADAIAAAFAWAAERARAGQGPTLIETVAMRMCGHAHHDDMLYLGRDPQLGWDYPPPGDGYANRELYDYWAARDPIALYTAKLQAES
ncbi:MAG TPA: thiamine pyrophosphate-dependent enzyme, partial [Vicinamibacterales bacterium]